MLLGVLGSLLLHGPDGAAVAVGAGRQRRLLAALALHAGAAVDRDVLAELVWGDDPPADPVAALQTYVARLRRLLPAPVSIHTGPRCTGWISRRRRSTSPGSTPIWPPPRPRPPTRQAGWPRWTGPSRCGGAVRSPSSTTRPWARRSPG